MNIQTAQKLLAKRGIEATPEQITSSIAPMSIDDITDKDIDFLVEQLQGVGSAITPVQQSTAITTPTKTRKTRKKQTIETQKIEAAAAQTAETQSNADAIVERLEQEVEPLLEGFDNIRTDIQKSAAAYILEGVATLPDDTLDLVKRGLGVMPPRNFRFGFDAGSESSATA